MRLAHTCFCWLQIEQLEERVRAAESAAAAAAASGASGPANAAATAAAEEQLVRLQQQLAASRTQVSICILCTDLRKYASVQAAPAGRPPLGSRYDTSIGSQHADRYLDVSTVHDCRKNREVKLLQWERNCCGVQAPPMEAQPAGSAKE